MLNNNQKYEMDKIAEKADYLKRELWVTYGLDREFVDAFVISAFKGAAHKS